MLVYIHISVICLYLCTNTMHNFSVFVVFQIYFVDLPAANEEKSHIKTGQKLNWLKFRYSFFLCLLLIFKKVICANLSFNCKIFLFTYVYMYL